MGYAIRVEPGSLGRVVGSIRSELQPDYQFELQTLDDVKRFARGQLSGFFSIGYAILMVAVITGALGLANTLLVSIIQRTRADSVLPNGQLAGSPEEAPDCACGLYLNDPTAWLIDS